MIAAYLVAAYHPFALDPPRYIRNGFEVGPDGSYHFDGTSVVRTAGAPSWLPTAIAEHRLTVALEVMVSDGEQDGPARLLTVSADRGRHNLTLAQDGADLIVRLRHPGSDYAGLPPIVVDAVFAAPTWQSIVVRIGPEEVTVEVDGRVAAARALEPAPLTAWNDEFRLALGGEVDGWDNGWSGSMRRAVVEVPGASIDYVTERSALVVPADDWYFPANPLGLHFGAVDMVLNLLGFIPFGAIFVLLRPGSRPVLRSARASVLLSLAMELGQVFVQRDPSVLDFALNVLGGTIGAALLVRASPRLASDR